MPKAYNLQKIQCFLRNKINRMMFQKECVVCCRFDACAPFRILCPNYEATSDLQQYWSGNKQAVVLEKQL